ncbi:MAG: acyclic terpene utilization AtuA family protein [Acidimicrobiales bacterium]
MPDTHETKRPVRIANCSGFYGDRLAAARELVMDGPVDVLTGDYLAELTMLILWKARSKDPERGYATTFLTQMEEVLATCIERGIKVVANAGGLNPAGLSRKLTELAARLGVNAKISYVDGDDIMPNIDKIIASGNPLRHMDTGAYLDTSTTPPVSANAYLGASGIRSALDRGADVVVTGRVTDASLVVGPSAWWHGWGREDWDSLAGAVVAGHVIECGTQATGGNYPFFREIPGLEHPGFPIAEVASDGQSVITKHEGTGGLVTPGTVTAQLLYEIAGPCYANPDVVADFSTIHLDNAGTDRVAISGVKGYPAPARLKVCINLLGGWRNSIGFVLTGLDIEGKAALIERTVLHEIGGKEDFGELDMRLVRCDHPDYPAQQLATGEFRITVKDSDSRKVGRAFSSKAIEMALASYPGLYLTSLPQDSSAYGVYWPALVDPQWVHQRVAHHDGTAEEVDVLPGHTLPLAETEELQARDARARLHAISSAQVASGAESNWQVGGGMQVGGGELAAGDREVHDVAQYARDNIVRSDNGGDNVGDNADNFAFAARPTARDGASTTGSGTGTGTRESDNPAAIRMPLGTIIGARSGDKGPNANVGFWARDVMGYEWLAAELTVTRLKELLEEARDFQVDRYELPNLNAVNFVVRGLLQEGVASSTRPDPQAKGLGEQLRSRLVEIPQHLLY